MAVVGHRSGVQMRAVLSAAGLVALVCGCASRPTQAPARPASSLAATARPAPLSPSPSPAAAPTPTAQRLLGTALAFDQQLPGVVSFGGREASSTQVGPSGSALRWTGDQWVPLVSATTPPPRSQAMLAPDQAGGVVLLGGQAETQFTPSCVASPSAGQPNCYQLTTPIRVLSDVWTLTGAVWASVDVAGAPKDAQLMGFDPSRHAVVVTGLSLEPPQGTNGTWSFDGQAWSLLAATTPDDAGSIGFDPASGQLLAYGGRAPFDPGPDSSAASDPGYTSTWVFRTTSWVKLDPLTKPPRSDGVLTVSPDNRQLLLIDGHGGTWTWTGTDWKTFLTSNQPALDQSTRAGFYLTAATDLSRQEVVLLVTGYDSNDVTWTLHGGTWTKHDHSP